MTVLITGGTVVSPTGRRVPTCSSTARRSSPCSRPGRPRSAATSPRARTGHRRHRQVRHPRRHRRHTHMELPFGGTEASDTFETGTRAAAWGGTTTIIDFAVQRTGERVQDGLAAWHDKAAGNCAIDYGFHQIIGGVDDDSLKAMDELVDEGITSFKLFMAYPGVFYSDDGQILRAMQKAARATARMIMMHAENGIAIDVLVAAGAGPRRDRPVQPRAHPAVADRGGGHPPRDHARATSPARRSTSCTCRPSRPSRSSPRPATRARTCSARPARSTSTCRSRSSSARSRGFEGAKWVCSTPLRSRAEGHQDELWQAPAHQRPADGLAPTTARSA